MSSFLEGVKAQAQKQLKTIVLPEGEDERTIKAAENILRDKTAHLVVIGDPQKIALEGLTVINPSDADNRDAYAEALYELRQAKGMTREQAYELIDDPIYYATMMVKVGDADGLVSGACHSTADTLRPALQILKTAPGTKLVSSFMVMCVPHSTYGHKGNFVFADIGLNQYPDADQLSEIAIASANSFKALMHEDPKVAFLSYSTHGSAHAEEVDKIIEATRLAQQKAPHLMIDGELQLDAALDAEVARLKAPESDVAGNANVLIFPNLDAGNIGYKLVQRLGGAEAYGPLLQGIARPVNDLSRGCSSKDIEAVVAITAVQAQLAERP